MTASPDATPDRAGPALAEFLRRRSPQVLMAGLLLSAALRLACGDWSRWDAVIAAGVFLYWPLNEWLIHVLVLHYRPRRIAGRLIDFHLPQTHREHHADPWRLDRVFVPGHVYPLVLPPLIWLAFWLFPTPALALSFLTTVFGLALNYEWTHYLAHIRWSPPIAYYRRRVRAHRAHHFRHEGYWWGVSRGEADWLFRTAPELRAIASTGTTRKLWPTG